MRPVGTFPFRRDGTDIGDGIEPLAEGRRIHRLREPLGDSAKIGIVESIRIHDERAVADGKAIGKASLEDYAYVVYGLQAWLRIAPNPEDRARFLAFLNTACRDFHADGVRLDAVHELHDSRAVTLLEDISALVDALSDELGRPLACIAESDRNDPRTVLPRAEHGLGMTAQWDDDVHHALHAWLTGESQGYYADFAVNAAEAVRLVLEGAFFHAGTYSG